MAIRLRSLARVCCLIGKIILLALLVCWAAAAPLVWILREGLGPGMVESVGMQAAYKFLVGWGLPALVLVVPLIWLGIIERWCQPADVAHEGARE